MRYMIRFEASIDAGGRVDRSAGGAGAAIGKILEMLVTQGESNLRPIA